MNEIVKIKFTIWNILEITTTAYIAQINFLALSDQDIVFKVPWSFS
jgi:hypothetical protein